MPDEWLRLDVAWERALYGPDGFYRRERPSEHFRTSAHASPLFATAILTLVRRLGLGTVVDLGAGAGELLRGLARQAPDLALIGVELRARPDDLPDAVGWLPALPETISGLVIANEFLDNVACPVVERDGPELRYIEVEVGTGRERLGGLVEPDDVAWVERWWPLADGERAEVGLVRDLRWQDVCARISHGMALAIDYGHLSAARRDSLTSYRSGVQTRVGFDGSRDVTAHVAFDSLAAAVGGEIVVQRDALRALGVDGSRPPLELATTDPVGYVRSLSAAGAAAELTDESGLGGFSWLLTPVGEMGSMAGMTSDAPGETRIVGVGAGASAFAGYERGGSQPGSELATEDMILNIGPQHPATHGVLRLRLTLDGERIVGCEPIVGYMHRGVEKLFEVRDYRQIIVLANRHDWLSAFSSELGVVLAVERMLGMEVPVRAVWARTLLAELNRVLNHLMFLGSYPLEVGAITPIFYAFRERETIQEVMEEISGGRMHYMFNRVGGLKEDLPAGWLDRTSAAIAAVRSRLPQIEDLIFGNEIFRARTRGIGVLGADAIAAYGVSGPIARASGVDVDLRRDDPYLAYAELAAAGVLKVALRNDGDCYARYGILLDQAKVSLDLADACIAQLRSLPQGPINVRLPKILKAPEGDTYAWTENPLGINGYYLVSRGEKTPYRMKLRSASFNNIAVLPTMLDGVVVADLIAILGSMFFVVGDIDK